VGNTIAVAIARMLLIGGPGEGGVAVIVPSLWIPWLTLIFPPFDRSFGCALIFAKPGPLLRTDECLGSRLDSCVELFGSERSTVSTLV
jgi:hypothetical protein